MDNEKRVNEYWSRYQEEERTRWWHSPKIIQHINYTICKKELDERNAGGIYLLREKLGSETIKRAVSVGCGSGDNEISFVKQGLVERFICFDIAEGMIDKARENARRNGVEDKMDFVCEDFFTSSYRNETYNMVFWSDSLHHMPDARAAVVVSYDILEPGGIFYCNDFIGNTRFQWTDMQMAIVNGLRLYLPETYFERKGGGKFNRYITAPSVEQMMRTDPSEAADSANIVPAVKDIFENPLIINTGGLIYHLCLEDIIQNMPEDSEILRYMLSLDDETIGFGLSLYSFILAQK